MKKTLYLLAAATLFGSASLMAQPPEVGVDGTTAPASEKIAKAKLNPGKPAVYQAGSRGTNGPDLVAYLATSNNTAYPKGYMYHIGKTLEETRQACGTVLLDADKGFGQYDSLNYVIHKSVENNRLGRFPYSLGYNRLDWYESIPSDMPCDETVQDPVTGQIYGVNTVSSKRGLALIDYANLTVTQICTFATNAESPYALGIGSDAKLYGVCQNGKLVTFDRKTGAKTEIGDTGLKTSLASTGCIDPETDVFYVLFYSSSKQALYTIDLKTAQATEVCNYTGKLNGRWASLHIPFQPNQDDATLDLPYSYDFATAKFMDSYWVFNLNKDERYWRYSNYYTRPDKSVIVGAGLCTANTFDPENTNCDDWLVTPKFKVEAGKTYEISMDCNAHLTPGQEYNWRLQQEFLTMKLGTSRYPKDMTTTIIPRTQIMADRSMAPERLTGHYKADKDGYVYLGIYGDGPQSSFVFVEKLMINEGVSQAAPSVSAIESVKPHFDENKADVVVKAPTTTIGGGSLSGTLKMELYRDNALIATKEGMTPGQSITFTDQAEAPAIYAYSARVYNSNGQGQLSQQYKAFVGVDKPEAVAQAEVLETSKGIVKVTWTSVAKGVSGYPLNTKNITYTVRDKDNKVVAEAVADTCAAFTVTNGPQMLTQYSVCALTVTGAGANAKTEMIPVGDAVDYPLVESFTDKQITTPTGWYRPYTWTNFFIESYENSNEIGVDGDHGYGDSYNATGEGANSLMLPKVRIPNEGNPSFTMFPKLIEGSSSMRADVRIKVYAFDNGVKKTVFNNTLRKQLNDKIGWGRVSVDLSQFKGHEPFFAIEFSENNYVATCFDRLTFGEAYTNDLAVTYLKGAPDEALPYYNLEVSVFNGGNTSLSYMLEISANDQVIKKISMPALAPVTYNNQTLTLPLQDIPENALIKAQITCLDDIAGNNFLTFQEGIPTEVTQEMARKNLLETGRYGIDGRQLGQDARGLMIIRYNDGSARKVMVE